MGLCFAEATRHLNGKKRREMGQMTLLLCWDPDLYFTKQGEIPFLKIGKKEEAMNEQANTRPSPLLTETGGVTLIAINLLLSVSLLLLLLMEGIAVCSFCGEPMPLWLILIIVGAFLLVPTSIAVAAKPFDESALKGNRRFILDLLGILNIILAFSVIPVAFFAFLALLFV